MRSLQSRVQFAGSSVIEEFEFLLHDECDEKYDGLMQLMERGVGVFFEVDFPIGWDKKSNEERQEIVRSQKFDLSLASVYFKSQCPATKADIKFLLQFPELGCLDIRGDELDLEDIESLSVFKYMGHLSICCRQFGDEIVPYLLQFEELISLHVDVEKMTEAGGRQLKTGIAKGTDLFLPMNLRDC